jgi:hypothetical protein
MTSDEIADLVRRVRQGWNRDTPLSLYEEAADALEQLMKPATSDEIADLVKQLRADRQDGIERWKWNPEAPAAELYKNAADALEQQAREISKLREAASGGVDLMSRLAEIERRPTTEPVDRYNVGLARQELTRLAREIAELREQVVQSTSHPIRIR